MPDPFNPNPLPKSPANMVGVPAGMYGGQRSAAGSLKSFVSDNVLSPIRRVPITTTAIQLPQAIIGQFYETCYYVLQVIEPKHDEGFSVCGWGIKLSSCHRSGTFRAVAPYAGLPATYGTAEGENAALILCRSDFFPNVNLSRGDWFAGPTLFPITNTVVDVIGYPSSQPITAKAFVFPPGDMGVAADRRWENYELRETPGVIRVPPTMKFLALFAVDQPTLAAQVGSDVYFETGIYGDIEVMPMRDDVALEGQS